jgi:protoporphyrinogen oxidase
LQQASVELEKRVERVDPGRRAIAFADGTEVVADAVVSSIPLPALVPMIVGAPESTLEAASKLACTKCVTVNVGIGREDLSSHHWTYFYDSDFVITRLSFPHLLSPHTVPPGCSSVQAEVYFSDKYRPLESHPQTFIEPVVRDLRRCGLLRDDDEILHTDARLIPYANVIFDHDRQCALQEVHGFLEDVGINYCGRYGEWGYQWTDESFVSGEEAAQRALDSR